MKKKKSTRLEFTEADKAKLKAEAKKRNIPLKNMLENHCIELIPKRTH